MKDGLKTVALTIGVIIAVVFMITLAFGLSGLIWWGIGSFVIWAFGINFVWTFWHGLGIAIILNALSGIFKVTIKSEE